MNRKSECYDSPEEGPLALMVPIFSYRVLQHVTLLRSAINIGKKVTTGPTKLG